MQPNYKGPKRPREAKATNQPETSTESHDDPPKRKKLGMPPALASSIGTKRRSNSASEPILEHDLSSTSSSTVRGGVSYPRAPLHAHQQPFHITALKVGKPLLPPPSLPPPDVAKAKTSKRVITSQLAPLEAITPELSSTKAPTDRPTPVSEEVARTLGPAARAEVPYRGRSYSADLTYLEQQSYSRSWKRIKQTQEDPGEQHVSGQTAFHQYREEGVAKEDREIFIQAALKLSGASSCDHHREDYSSKHFSPSSPSSQSTQPSADTTEYNPLPPSQVARMPPPPSRLSKIPPPPPPKKDPQSKR